MTLTARAVLKANRLFRDLPESAIDKLAALAQRKSCRRGTRIFSEGDPGTRCSASSRARCASAPAPPVAGKCS